MGDLLLVGLLGVGAAIVALLLQRTWMERTDTSRRRYPSDTDLRARWSAVLARLRAASRAAESPPPTDRGKAASPARPSATVRGMAASPARPSSTVRRAPREQMLEAAAPVSMTTPDRADGPAWPQAHLGDDARGRWERVGVGCPGCASSLMRGAQFCARCGRRLASRTSDRP